MSIFSLNYLEYIEEHQQATIVAQNEPNYHFFQYSKDADFKVTRPFNATLLYSLKELDSLADTFFQIVDDLRKDGKEAKILDPSIINRTIYTLQQCIGCALDIGSANRARKLNGDLFEHLILTFFNAIGVSCSSSVVSMPIEVEGQELFSMKFQHDLIAYSKNCSDEKVYGSIKTTSKDRIGKVFFDKLLYEKLSGRTIPYIAIFLHDVQRKKTKRERVYGVSSTFLTGHFKGYTVKINPLDGVYYLDPRPNMVSDDFLSEHIKTFDCLVREDIWSFLG